MASLVLLCAGQLSGVELAELKDGTYPLVLTHELPVEALELVDGKVPDKAYEAIEGEGVRVVLKFWDGSKKLAIQPLGILGDLAKGKSDPGRTYALKGALTAGGELTMKQTPKGVQVTMTTFGSGEAVIGSVRGLLLAKDEGALDDKRLELIARCGVSKVPNRVYVRVKGAKLSVPLPEDLHGKLDAGEKGWIGVVGVCRMIPQGGPLTAESCDGSIEVEKILFYDQKEDRKESLKILE